VKSLRAQLTLRLLGGGALLLGAAAAALDWDMRRALNTELDASLHAAAQFVTTYIEQKIGGVKVEKEAATAPQYETAGSDQVFLLRTVAGAEVQRSSSLDDDALPLRSGTRGELKYFDAALPDGRALRCAAVRFVPKMAKKAREDNAAPVEVVLTVGRDRASLERTLATLHAALLAVGAGAVAGLATLVCWGLRGGLAPLARLGEEVAAVDANSLATRFSTSTLPAELQPIAARLNELLARLEAAFAREQRFTSATAHELRTPLAELRSLAEVNLTTPATDEERAESWRDTLATTRRMEALALRLLELTRCEDPARVIERTPVALDDALAEAWHPWAARAAGRGIALDSTLAAECRAQADATLLGIVLGNLCGNAAVHAPEGAALRVSAARDDGAVTLFFHNSAGDLTAADMPHLFERFWRKDGARADGQHHGLGLALAAEFAALLDGALTARLCADGDVEFALRLPSA
jgi:two-component system sensor histidine kinase QseC